MSKEPLLIALPFEGFYNSIWSDDIDRETERFAECEANERQKEDGIPPELHLTEDEYAEIAFDCIDHCAAYKAVCVKVTDAWCTVWDDLANFNPNFEFESMDSPREYNFATDRLFAHVPRATVAHMMQICRRDRYETLGRIVNERFTSRSGFISYYSNDVTTWQGKPLSQWDHNELQTLMLAALEILGYDESSLKLYYAATECDGFYHEFDGAMDWPKFYEKVEALRDEKRAELASENPGYVPPYRCDKTGDMFAWAAS